jgi:metacaspase-1
VRVRSAA